MSGSECVCYKMGPAIVNGKALWIRAPKALIEPLAKSPGYLPLLELDRPITEGPVPAYVVKADLFDSMMRAVVASEQLAAQVEKLQQQLDSRIVSKRKVMRDKAGLITEILEVAV